MDDKIIVDTSIPFSPNQGLWNPREQEHQKYYFGKCTEGFTKNFNVFWNRHVGEYIIMFGRVTRLSQFDKIIERI